MKIAVISIMATDLWGGSEGLWSATAHEALRLNHQVGVFVHQWGQSIPKITQLVQAGAQVFHRPLPNIPTNRLSRLKNKIYPAPNLLLKQLSAFQPDVVFVSQGATFDVAASHAVQLFKFLQENNIPHILICHQNDDSMVSDESIRVVVKDIFTKMHSVMFVAEHNLRSAERQLAQAITNGVVVKNPVNLDFNEAPPTWPSFKTLHIANVASMHVCQKGQDLLLQALSCDRWRERDWVLSFYGKGPHRDYLESLVAHYKLEQHIVFAGHVSDIREIWSKNHLLVLPSRREGTPLALIEAMLCARPSLVTDVGGNAEWIEHHKTGFVAQAASINSLRKTLEEVWNQQERLVSLGEAAYRQAIARIDSNPGKTVLEYLTQAAQTNQHKQIA